LAPLKVRTRALIGTAALALAVVIEGCGGTNPGFPPPPPTAPVNSLVLISANGRVLTARGAMACGHRPRLVARSYPDRVTLILINPDTSCNAEAIKQVAVSTSLPTPLGARALVQASTGARIRYRQAP
jgi:hypothetical protein